MVMRAAKRIAQQLGARHVGTEHVLLALLEQPAGDRVAADILAAAGVEGQRVLGALHPTHDADRSQAGSHATQALPLSPRVRRLLEGAAQATADHSPGPLRSVHLLLGLVGVTDATARRVLVALGADPAALTQCCIERLRE